MRVVALDLAYEADIKELILNHKELFTKDPNTAVIFEKAICGGNVIADCLIFTDTEIIGVEIKTAHDTTKRLPKQLTDYLQVCDKVYVLTHDLMYPKVDEVLQSFPSVGLLTYAEVNDNIYVGKLKEAELNLPDFKMTLSMLWSSEIKKIGDSLAPGNRVMPYKVSSKRARIRYLLSQYGDDIPLRSLRNLFIAQDLDPGRTIPILDFRRYKPSQE